MNSPSVIRLIASAALLSSPVAASAAEATASGQPAASVPAAKNNSAASTDEKKICKQLPSSSSRLPQRVCLTEKQWKQVDADSQ